jgi:hypothetical protein
MNYKQKSEKVKELFYKTNKIGDPSLEHLKWRNQQELAEYLAKFGGQIKTNKKRRKGYLIVHLQKKLYAEIPMDFAERALVLGFP